MGNLTRGRYYGTVMPIWAIIYVMGLVAFDNKTFTVVGALMFALLAVLGSVFIKPCEGSDRSERRARRRATRG